MEPYSSDDVKRRKKKHNFERHEPEKGFKLLKREFEISGTNYRIQVGLLNGRYLFNILDDKTLVDSHVFEDRDNDRFGLSRQNSTVGWILRVAHELKIDHHPLAESVVDMMKYLTFISSDQLL